MSTRSGTPQRAFAVGAACIVLLSTGLAFGQEVEVAPGDLTLDTVVQTIKAATDACRQTKPVAISQYVPGQDEYARVIKPLVEAGPQALPLLQQAAQDERLDAVERRVAQIVAARIEQPELFAQVAPYYEPVADPWAERVGPQGQQDVGVGPPLPPLSPELMRPEDRLAWQAYRQAEGWREYQAVVAKYERLLEQLGEENYGTWAAVELAIARTRELDDVARRHPPPQSRPDPRYRLAWEEGAIRPLPVQVKVGFIRHVAAIGEGSSLPLLGMLLRQSDPFAPHPYANYRWCSQMALAALAGLLTKPNDSAMHELAQAVRESEGRSKLQLQWRTGQQLLGRPEWLPLIADHNAVPGDGSDADIVQQCIAIYKAPPPAPPPAGG